MMSRLVRPRRIWFLHSAKVDYVILVPESFARRACNGFAQLGGHFL